MGITVGSGARVGVGVGVKVGVGVGVGQQQTDQASVLKIFKLIKK